jgi:hypothetical protein
MSETNNPGLGLSSLTQQDDVVTGEERRFELRQDGVLVSENGRRRAGRPSLSRSERLARNSSRIERDVHPLARSAPRVVGKCREPNS